MGAVLDLFRVLFEPTAVFERVREKPRVLLPLLAIIVLSLIIGFLSMPYVKAALGPMLARQAQAGGGQAPNTDVVAMTQVIGSAVFIPIYLAIAAGVLWLLLSLFGGEAKYKLMFAVATYSAMLYIVQLVAGFAVLSLKGVENITSPEDLQPAFGLDLLAPNVRGYVGAVLKGINVFSLWGVVVQGIGISVTHRVAKGTGYTVAAVAFAILVLLLSLFALLQPSS